MSQVNISVSIVRKQNHSQKNTFKRLKTLSMDFLLFAMSVTNLNQEINSK
jgi:hypothetical protein